MKSFESGSPRKFIPAKFFIRSHPRKLIPAKCKYLAVFLNRESFFPRKFLPLKYSIALKIRGNIHPIRTKLEENKNLLLFFFCPSTFPPVLAEVPHMF